MELRSHGHPWPVIAVQLDTGVHLVSLRTLEIRRRTTGSAPRPLFGREDSG